MNCSTDWVDKQSALSDVSVVYNLLNMTGYVKISAMFYQDMQTYSMPTLAYFKLMFIRKLLKTNIALKHLFVE